MRGARVFVAVAFLILGASFLAATGLLILDFRALAWGSMVVAHSHLFLFFPIFGVLALVAFYLPSVVFTDLYWRHMPYGKARLLGGLALVGALSIGVGMWLDAAPRALWEVAPSALLADRGDPPDCDGTGNPSCRRAPILSALAAKPS